MADILPDSHFMENLYRKNQNLFERVLNKLKEFVKNVREYFAHVNPNTKLEAAVLKENTESGMRYLEKIVEAFDKTAEAAVENYQQGTTESTAESKTQYKTRGKYWRPDLKGSEWQLLERRMAEEIGSRENFLDEATKWVYANEKGVQVFALYGIGDGTEATPLYASAGRTARADAKMLMDYTVEENQYDGNRKDLNTLLEGYGRSNGNGSRNFSDGKRGSAKNRVAGLSGGSQRVDGGGTAERGTEDQRGVKEKFSLRDSAGRELTEAQQAYFKDSKVRDADGNLLVMYRGGTGTETVFDRKKSKYSNLYGRGFYFTHDESRASQYGGVRAFYLNVQTPLSPDQNAITKKQMRKFLEAVQANEDECDFWNYGESATVDSVLRDIYGKGDFEMLQDVNATAIGDLVAAVELFNDVNGTNYDGIILPEETVTFTSNQAKKIDNKTPTADPDIRYSLREIGGKVMPVLDIQNDTRDYKVAETYLKTLVNTEHPFATILVDAQPVYIGKDLPGEYKGSEYTHGLNSSTRQVKMQAATNLDEMLLLAENGEWRENVKDKHKQDAKNGWYRYSTRFAVPVLDIKKAVDHYTVYSGTLLIRNDADGKSYLYDLLDIKKEKVISSTSFSARERSEVFEPKPSQEQYMQNSRESQAENTGNDRHALRDVAMSDRDVLRRAADLALSDRKMNFTQADRERLKIFKKRLDILDEKQTQRQGYLQTKRDILSNSARLF